MTFLRSSGQYAIPFVLGLILGAIGMFGYTLASKKPPKVRFQGLVRLDTASHNNAYLSNAIYLQNPTLGLDKIYLNFRDDAVMNAAINRRISATGHLQTVEIGDGQSVVALDVVTVEHIKP
jgi:hypothetical protein